MRILCVEDDAANRDIINSLARLEGDTLLTAATGRQALALLVEKPDLILVDVGLPDMNGLILIRQMREALPEVPIIALTANALLDDEERCRDAGATGYVPKPFDFEALRAYLRQYRHPPASQLDAFPA
jgi:CheY-like chemotaxis protein